MMICCYINLASFKKNKAKTNLDKFYQKCKWFLAIMLLIKRGNYRLRKSSVMADLGDDFFCPMP
ncbi:hypothetical protein EGI32_05865 [Ferruginibacter sp. HRS2-29]|nr:hypothetical protein [Ferruginibacter sp. HRS2-29]